MRVSPFVLGAAMAALAGCAVVPPTEHQLQQAYAAAVADARIAEPQEIVTDLIPVTAYDERLVWEGEPGASRVKVVTWTKADFFDDSVGKDYDLPQGANIWVTLVPQLRNFFEDHEPSDLRIEQLLGLPPHSGYTKFVELWVHPDDLYRPCPDPEIIDTTCGLSFPTTTSRFLAFTDTVIVDWKGDAQAPMDYPQWFDNRKATGYDGAHPYPWTRLGYTYDWARPEHPVGMSEFVIPGKATIGVASVTPTAAYLR